MRKDFKWNKVYNLIMDIKDDYNNNFNDNSLIFKEWLNKLNKEEYNNIFQCLQTNQKDNFLLI